MSEHWDFFYMFQTLAEILKKTEPGPSFSQLIHDHLSPLSKEFGYYFPTTKDPQTKKEWICNPYVKKPGESILSLLEKDQLLEIPNDGGLKSMFETTSNLHTFWIKVTAEYPEIATEALKSPSPFPTSYLCEAGFSAVTVTKMNLWSRLDISNTVQCHCLPSPPDGISLLPVKLRAPTDSALWWVIYLFHYMSQGNNNRNKVHNKCNALE